MKKTKETLFNEYLSFLNPDEAELVRSLFVNFKQHMNLPLGEERKMRIDLEKALMYYNAIGVPVREALNRLDNENLGGFYARPPILYYSLDDAARIYPLSLKHGHMAVFRLSATLKDDVVPELLQIALTFTIKRFPRFATTLKKGFFWHYLDANKKRYDVEEDEHLPCRPIKVANTFSKSFRVLYYQKRISVEFFHSLTDGRGGLIFLQTLIATYLHLCGSPKIEHESILDINGVPSEEESANEFKRATATKASGFKEKKALQLSGRHGVITPTQILHFGLNTQELVKVAKDKGLNVTSYLVTLLILAAKYATDAKKGDIAIQIPVDMRRYYESKTLANFTMYAGIRVPYCKITNFADVSAQVKEQMSAKTSTEKMSEMMFSAHKMNSNLKLIPLFLKSPIAKIVYGILGEALFTTTFSNVGVVKAPEEFKNYIDSFDFVLGAPSINGATTSLITYEDKAIFTITKSTKDPSFEEEFYRLLNKDELTINLEGSAVYEDQRHLPRKKHQKKH